MLIRRGVDGGAIRRPLTSGGIANAVGPVKIGIINPTYTASPCPKDRPIPGEKAMKGMRGLCVKVKAELAENSPKVREAVPVPLVTASRACVRAGVRAGGGIFAYVGRLSFFSVGGYASRPIVLRLVIREK